MSLDEAVRPTRERLLALWDHLGIGSAHVASQVPADIADFAAHHPERVGGVVLCVPTRLDPAPFAAIADRVLMIAGSSGPTAGTTARAAGRLPGGSRVVLDGYDAQGWADAAADRPDIADAMIAFFERLGTTGHAIAPPGRTADAGSHAGITWRMQGNGPALVLMPFFLAPSQWEPVLPRLASRFTVVTLGGPHLGGVAALEDRARAPSYQAMFRTLIELMAPASDSTFLEVGCGSGSLTRLLARQAGPGQRISAVDVNPFLLEEARALAGAEGMDAAIEFRRGNAEALPFPDQSFDCVYSVTVLEECDADRAIAEMVRVARPGGRVGVIVRAIDMPQWWNLPAPEALRQKIDVPPQSVAARGVADASLYRRMRQAGLQRLVCFPSLVTLDRPDGQIWRYREDHVLSQLSPDETTAWRALCDAARREELLFMAHPMHCAVGVKSGGS
jgi:ubiquinone/menaquinone biosynthesis C-methylase UbiE